MQNFKLYTLILLLTFSFYLSPSTVGNELVEDIIAVTKYTTRPLSYSLEDSDSKSLYDWLNIIIGLDVQNISSYQMS